MFELGCSIGVVFDDLKQNVVNVLRKADIAMYAAKKDPFNAWKFFDAEMDRIVFERQFLEVELKSAIKYKELDVYFQPIFDMQSNEVHYFEALARWNHRQNGMIAPDVFIPIAEETGLIFELGDFILEKACSIAMTWKTPFPVAVNVSAHQIHDPNFIKRVKKILNKTQFPPERLEIELTESVLIEEIDCVKSVIEQLRAMNISVALDDFGTGYSSLAYLHAFEFDKVKIDRELIHDLKKSNKNRAILDALICMCNDMSISLVAEGIETEDHLIYLKQKNSHYGQGFLLGRPKSEFYTKNFCDELLDRRELH